MNTSMVTWEGTFGYVDASDLGLAPGVWPMTIVVPTINGGEGVEFRKFRDIQRGGELAAVIYRSTSEWDTRRVVTVMND